MVSDAEWEFGGRSDDPRLTAAEKAETEAENSVLLAEWVLDLVRLAGDDLRLTPEVVKTFHRIATQGVLADAGEYRGVVTLIDGASHVPPNHKQASQLVAEMCEYANAQCSADPTGTAAFLLWRLNWIHPFRDGNGRVSRALADLAMCVGFGGAPAGPPTIASLILTHRDEYETALADADRAWTTQERVNGAALDTLLCNLLIEQAERQH